MAGSNVSGLLCRSTGFFLWRGAGFDVETFLLMDYMQLLFSLGENVNPVWGTMMLAFGLLMLFFSKRNLDPGG